MEELVKVCPGCKAEYLPHIERCADCGELLVLPGQPANIPPVPAAPPTQSARDLVCIRVADLDWARRLGARLERAGIDHMLEPQESPGAKCCGGTGRFRVMVRQSDHEAAGRIDAEQLCEDVPEMAGVTTGGASAETCPACGDPVPASAAECPSCGLALVIQVEGCPGCGAPLPPGAPHCPNCGRETARSCG